MTAAPARPPANGDLWPTPRPMSEAPRDGTRILWRGDNGEYTKRRWSYCVVWWPEYQECFEHEPGVWWPLPLDPQP